MIDAETFQVLDRVIQWVVIPLIMWMWHLHGRVGMLEKVDVKLTTLIEERRGQRMEDREATAEHLRELARAIERLNERLDRGEGRL